MCWPTLSPASRYAVTPCGPHWIRREALPRENGYCCAPLQTAWNGPTAGPSRQHNACASCSTSAMPRACALANWSAPSWVMSASTSTVTTGCIWLAKVANQVRWPCPPLAYTALDQYLAQRQLPVSRERWNPKTPLVGSLGEDGNAGITGPHLWCVLRRFFTQAAEAIEADHPVAAEKLRRATPHWMRHSHASHALARGAQLTAVRDNLRHASIATTSMYLHGDELERARQMRQAFGARHVKRGVD